MSHPHEGNEPSALSEDQEQTEADGIVADILTIAHSAVFDSVHSSQARRSLADHLVEEAEDQHQLPLSEEEQLRVASAAFDEHRCARPTQHCNLCEAARW